MALEEFSRLRLSAAGFTREQQDEIDLSNVEEVDRRIAERQLAAKTVTGTDGGQPNGKNLGAKQKVIPLNELSKWVDDYGFSSRLNSSWSARMDLGPSFSATTNEMFSSDDP